MAEFAFKQQEQGSQQAKSPLTFQSLIDKASLALQRIIERLKGDATSDPKTRNETREEARKLNPNLAQILPSETERVRHAEGHAKLESEIGPVIRAKGHGQPESESEKK